MFVPLFHVDLNELITSFRFRCIIIVRVSNEQNTSVNVSNV